MGIELNQTLFKRLVWLHISLGLLSFFVYLLETSVGVYRSYIEKVDALTIDYYGSILAMPTPLIVIFAVYAVGLICWWIASVYGILRFKRWGRFGFWATFVAALPIMFFPGVGPSTSFGINLILEYCSTALFGAVLVIAYAQGMGHDWFNEDKVSGT